MTGVQTCALPIYIIDHQEKYSDEEIREILQDEECRKLYQTMVEVDSALESPSPIINVCLNNRIDHKN